MHPKPLTIDTVNTSHGTEYHIVDLDGTIYATTYDAVAAGICCDAMNDRYPV